MMPSYGTNDPKGWCGDIRRGAALGRPSLTGNPESDYYLVIKRVPIADGYDANGTYFGEGLPLFWVASTDGDVDFMLRGRNRAEVLSKVQKLYPNCRILTVAQDEFRDFVRGYIECAAADALDDHANPEDLSRDTQRELTRRARRWFTVHVETMRKLSEDFEQHGYDLWLTQNRHGVGFWDRGYADAATVAELTEASHKEGELHVVKGNRGKFVLLEG